MNVDFIDSNVLLYIFDETSPEKQAIAEGIVTHAISTGTGIVSFQVVQETMNVLSGKLGAAARDVELLYSSVLEPLWKVSPSAQLYRDALHIKDRYRYSFFDSLIITAALQSGCQRLLTEDMQDGQQIQSLLITNPFKQN